MTTVFLCGKQSDRSLRCVLPQALSGYGGVQYFNGTELLRLGGAPLRFLVYEWETLPNQPCPKGILFFKNSFQPQAGEALAPGLLPVFESRNPVVSAFLREQGAVAVTCGTAARDTLSVSSLDYHSAMVSLQRCMTTLSGEIIEPGDIPVSLRRSHSPHQILAAVSVLLLSGIPWERGYNF